MADDRTSVDQALDLLVYAPLGLALSARDLLPTLAQRGREQLTSQVGIARMIGQFAVKRGTAEAEKALARAREQALATLTDLGLVDDAAREAAGRSTAPSSAGATEDDVDATVDAPSRGTAPASSVPVPSGPPSEAAPSGPTAPPVIPTSGAGPVAADLPIPDYDSLSASQVVPRLSGLIPTELEVVQAYETAHRGRKTILNKITQLEAR